MFYISPTDTNIASLVCGRAGAKGGGGGGRGGGGGGHRVLVTLEQSTPPVTRRDV